MDEGRLLRCGLRAAHAIINNDPFAPGLAEELLRIVGVDCVCIDVCSGWRQQRPSVTFAGEPGDMPEADIDQWMALSTHDPYMMNLLVTGDPRPYRTSDLMAFSQFQQTPIYREVYSRYGMQHLLVMAPHFAGRDLVLIGLTRRLRDFSDRETCALGPMRDLIAAALTYEAQVAMIRARISVDLPSVPTNRFSITERENQVLALIATGYTNDQAARRLGISSRTVRKHLESVFSKADVSSRTAAVAWWLRQKPGPGPA